MQRPYSSFGDSSALTVATTPEAGGAVVSSFGDQLPIQVCGRTCHIDARSRNSLTDIQTALQQSLGMHEQDFDLTDSLGSRICTDLTLHDSISRGHIPLQATLSDASVHFIENRREELAQMQWKVVRDKIQGCSSDVLTMSRQIAEMRQQMDVQRRQSETAMEVLRGELVKATEQEHTLTQASLQQVSERIHSAISLVNGEQNKREFSYQSLERQIQDLRRTLDIERAARLQENDNHLHLLKDGKVALEAQKQIMESVEKQHAFDIHELKSEISSASRSFSAMVSEQMHTFRASTEEVALKMQSQDSEVSRQLVEMQNNVAELSKTVHNIDVRCDSLDMRLSQVVSNQTERFQKHFERQEQVTEALDNVRLEKHRLEVSLQTNMKRMKELETSLAKSEDEARKLVEREGTAVRTELERAQRQLASHQDKQIAELEMKVTERLENDSVSRAAHSKQIYEEIGKVASRRQPDDASGDTSDVSSVPGFSSAFQVSRSPPTPSPRLFSVTHAGSLTAPCGMTSGPNSAASAGSPRPAWNSFGHTPRVAGQASPLIAGPGVQHGYAGLTAAHGPLVTRTSLGGSVVVHRATRLGGGTPGVPHPTCGVRSVSADASR
eukprot:gb/GFBE01032812.1/.p1 GENE.gb/GFBE01032812.1/~~gb/GFBE01032812.1/.p1  ORF type:complete len:611 (+),score=99.75 gb/GFBE01032812.1/:1-1833(+)